MNFDQLDFARLHRAHGLIGDAIGTSEAPPTREAHAKAFIQYAKAVASNQKAGLREALESHPNPLVRKAAAHALHDGVWTDRDAAALAAGYIESISELSLIDQLAKHARVVPVTQRSVLLASGTSADVTAEGGVKLVKRIALAVDTEQATKVAAIVVITAELLRETGSELFERELREAIVRATNQAVLADLVGGATITVAATGDALADLRAGIAAAGPSNGYVVAAPTGVVAELSTRVEASPGFGVRGGEFRPGVSVVAVDDISETIVVPASRVAMWIGDLEARRSGEGSVSMSDSPDSPGSSVSLWQTGCTGLICERRFHLFPSDTAIVVVGGGSP